MTEGINWLVLSHGPMVTVDDGSPLGLRPQLKVLPEPLEFRLLGQVEVLREGKRLSLGGHRQLAVLARLVMEAGRVVSVERLIDALWGERPPAGARATVQAYLSKLRRVLEPDGPVGTRGSLLATRGGGYVLEVDPEAVDAQRFQRLASEGRTALAAGRPEAATDLFDHALALWRGPALADFTFETFAAAEIARLEELRLSVTEDQLEAALALGRHRAVVAELEPLVAAHPYRERLRAQLMTALYRSGRQAEALRAYQAVRRVLAEELGIDPSPALKALEGAILRQDPALEWVPPIATAPLGGAPVAAGETDNRSGETVTFLSSDVEGLNRLRAEHPVRAAAVVARHEELMAKAVMGHGGTLSDESGDGNVLGVFSRAGEALVAALALQRALAAEPWPDGTTVQVRIGLRTREVVAGDGDTHGRRLQVAPKSGQRELVVA